MERARPRRPDAPPCNGTVLAHGARLIRCLAKQEVVHVSWAGKRIVQPPQGGGYGESDERNDAGRAGAEQTARFPARRKYSRTCVTQRKTEGNNVRGLSLSFRVRAHRGGRTRALALTKSNHERVSPQAHFPPETAATRPRRSLRHAQPLNGQTCQAPANLESAQSWIDELE